MSSDSRRLAVLIDADNTSPRLTREMFEELARYGTLTVKRAYGDWTTPQLSGWKEHLLAHAISPIQQFAYTTGKNSTDSALIIDAMDLLYSGHVDGFVIVSSDSDFTRLATRLRESGMSILGVGQRKTPKPFVEACEKFIFLEVLSGETTREQETAETTDPGALQSLLTKALAKTAGDDDWSSLGAVGSHLVRNDPSFDSRTYGSAKLSDLVASLPYVEVKNVEDGPGRGQLWVRPKRRRTTTKAAGSARFASSSPDVAGESADGAPTAPAAAAKAASGGGDAAEASTESKRTTRRTSKRAAAKKAAAQE